MIPSLFGNARHALLLAGDRQERRRRLPGRLRLSGPFLAQEPEREVDAATADEQVVRGDHADQEPARLPGHDLEARREHLEPPGTARRLV